MINRLQFFITPGCTLYIYPRDAIMLGIRMEFTLKEFFAAGGVTTFADRMAAVLGIHKADVKTVQVYKGSTVVEFMIVSDPEAEEPLDLNEVETMFVNAMLTIDTFMGSPVLNAVSGTTPIKTPHTPSEESEEKEFTFSDSLIEGGGHVKVVKEE